MSIMVVMALIAAAAGEFDLEHRQSGTSHSVLPSLQKVSGSNDDDDDDGGSGVDDDGDDEVQCIKNVLYLIIR